MTFSRRAGLVCLVASALAASRPEDVGISSERLKRVHEVMQRYIDNGEIAGSVTLVARKGKMAHLEAQGLADLESKRPMRTDAIFRLASMTKPLTSVAVMMLHEEGRFILNDPISKFLPEFKNPKVAIANAPNERFEGGFRVVPADREITIRDLLTHTAGLASGTGGATMELVKKIPARKADDVMADYVKRLATLPLNFQPGTAWGYGPATDVLGRLVEVISDKTLDEFFKERIFAPLGMKDTHFYLPDGQLPRLASVYKKDGGRLEKLTVGGPEARKGKYFAGAGGLAGSAEDYLRFAQALLDGRHLVSRKTVESMTANHIGQMPMWNDTLRGHRFGLGFRVRSDLGESGILGSVGSYGWGGAYGTYFFIDPKEQTVGILMFQLMPYVHLNIRQEFHNAVMQSIVD